MLTWDEYEIARRYRAGDMSYSAIGKKLGGKSADEVRDALIPGWRESPIARGRHAVKEGQAA